MTDLDLDALLTPERWDPKRCQVAQALAEISDGNTRAKVAAACDDPRVPGRNIVTAFERLIGEGPAPSAISRHRRRLTGYLSPCTCPKP